MKQSVIIEMSTAELIERIGEEKESFGRISDEPCGFSVGESYEATSIKKNDRSPKHGADQKKRRASPQLIWLYGNNKKLKKGTYWNCNQ